MAKRKERLGKRLVRDFEKLRDGLKRNAEFADAFYEWSNDAVDDLLMGEMDALHPMAIFYAGFDAALRIINEREKAVIINCCTSRTKRKAKPRRRLLDGEIYVPKEYAEMIPTLRTNKRKAKP